MRIVLVSPYALSVHGGVQEQTLSMSRSLSERGHDVLVIAPDGDDTTHYDTPATVRCLGSLVSVRANGSRAPITLQLSVLRETRRLVEEFAPDVVHLHEPVAPLLGWSLLGAHRWPIVATFHRSGGFSGLRYARPLFTRLRRGVDAAVAVSESAQRTAQQAFGVACSVLFNGIDVATLRRSPRKVPTESVIVTVGRLEERKGVATLIEAVLAHNRESEEGAWRLCIVGDGPERAALEKLAYASPAVTFVGALANPEKNELLRSASVIVCPALRGESFGIVVLEAMACEVPVVASDIDGYRQASGAQCLLSPPGDSSAMVRAIEEALRTSPQAIDSATAYAAQWSMSALVDRYESIYAEAIEHFASR